MAVVPALEVPRETNRLHRWAMWRMTVNEGIIGCISEGASSRAGYPDTMASDARSLDVTESVESPYFPFVTAEQMSIARKMNLREKYGTSLGLSEDSYFIFGLPRIRASKEVPEVTHAGTRSVYDSYGDLRELNNNAVTSNNYVNARMTGGDVMSGGGGVGYSEMVPGPDRHSLPSRDDVEVQRINGYREEWRTPPPAPASPVPRLNLYSIQEELSNSNHMHSNSGEATDRYSSDRFQPVSAPTTYRETTDRSTERLNDMTASSFNVAEIIERFDRLNESTVSLNNPRENAADVYSSARRFQNNPATNYYSSDRDRYSHLRHNNANGLPVLSRREPSPSYAANQLSVSVSPYYSGEEVDRYTPGSPSRHTPHGRAEPSDPYAHVDPRHTSQQREGMGRYSSDLRHTSQQREVVGRYLSDLGHTSADRYPADLRYTPYSSHRDIDRFPSDMRRISPQREVADRYSHDMRHNGIPGHTREDTYPPFSPAREAASHPQRSRSYSPSSASPRHGGFSPLPPHTGRSYSPSPASPRHGGFSPLPQTNGRSHSPSSAHPRHGGFSPLPPHSGGRSYSPSPRQSSPPLQSTSREMTSPGYAKNMRPTNLLSDGDAERLKRQAYYDWTTPTQEFYRPIFAPRAIY